LDAIARYIRQEFQASGAKVSEQPYQVNGITYRNVVAGFGPREADLVVIGAHYDAAGLQPGADDNASGVAGLLELARALGANPPAMQVELVAYTLEEPPFFRTPHMGSTVHAKSLRAQEKNVRAMISLEMIGYFTGEPESQRFPLALLRHLYPRTGNFIAVVGKLGQWETVRRIKQAIRGSSDLPVRSINAPAWVTGVDFSDHLNYWAAGYRAVMITDTAFYRNDRYHTSRDTADSLDYERMAKVVRGVICAIHALSQT
jgi:Zn-dependent M28 family amino/carboxypeptidase